MDSVQLGHHLHATAMARTRLTHGIYGRANYLNNLTDDALTVLYGYQAAHPASTPDEVAAHTYVAQLAKVRLVAAAVDFYGIGRRAFLAGESNAPALNPEVMAAIDDVPVGGGATRIMAEFTRGWTAASAAAEVAL